MNYITVPLDSSHKKRNFNCNKSLLDNYLHAQAKQDVKRKLSACFILADDENNVKVLGRLAVDNLYKGQGLGELLLIEALKRSYYTSINSVASMAVIVDPIDDDAVKFYNKYGFILLPDSGKMFISMETISELF